ncbi:hypothetical protein [Coraliomargarita akajimensis]|uniref:Uncharacterized protein n=1 Tax=Coraliomargarita akajimensis (strain DSM 45221 / IAM 15411 / JCM 23193 / KCTC 12865 / 04OKA010-24) TaxID=583355 RepID=D5ELZ3_CORAD|nr:hypothetical protein [Coraliomargarita akajimensis]ADE53318.1 hypothetical protein Caka_0292 [Coraliomargarita akajimensis DSM 45221]
MKRIITALLLPLAFAFADDRLPPEKLRAEWSELKEIQLSELEITGFHGWDMPFDGGSKVFFLEANSDRFEIVVANPNYWTEEDKAENRQVFYLRAGKNRFYLIEPKSAEESIICDALLQASKILKGKERKNPTLLVKLSELLKSREPIFTIKG